jgi:hypothetical protein
MAASDGPLTDDQRRLLVAHYDFYRLLDAGNRTPTTEAQRHFIAVCRGTAAPATDHEQAYLKFKSAIAAINADEAGVVASGFIFPTPSAVRDESDCVDGEFIEIPMRRCAGCGMSIPPERLEAIPEATRCVSCQHQEEGEPTDWHISEIECPRCAANGVRSQMVWRTARDPSISGYFLGCSRFPECRYVDSRGERQVTPGSHLRP